jgi:hypothetical protein
MSVNSVAQSLRIKDTSGLSISSVQVHSPYNYHVLIPDFVQSIGWALSSYNLAHDRLWPGFACNVQGFLINVGDVGSSVWSLVIAIHTVLLLAGGQRTRIWAAEKSTSGKGRWILCVCIWMSIIFLGLIGPLVIEHLYTDKGPFCIQLQSMTG